MQVNEFLMKQQLQIAQEAQAENFLKSREASLTLGTTASPFSGNNFFDLCTDELMSLHYKSRLPLLDWMGFNPTDTNLRTFEFITYVKAASSSAGYLSDPCADPNGWEFGKQQLSIEDFGRYGRSGPARDVHESNLRYCERSPRYRLDGTLVTSEAEWDMVFTMEQILQDISRDIVVGNATSNAGQMDGLEQLVATTYSGTMLDSVIIDWNGNTMSGGSGITWNGNAVGSTYDFVDVLRAVVRRIKQRISWSSELNSQQMNLGDMILVMPTHVANCLLDFFTCWSVCAGSQYNEVSLQTYEARQFRNGINGGLFGFGTITIEQVPIPILAYDWGLIKSPSFSDVYLLTGSVGSVRLWEGELLSATSAVQAYGDRSSYFSTDGGRVLAKYVEDNLCIQLRAWLRPRMWTRAPWAQVRFQNVSCTQPGGIISPDPEETSWYPESSMTAAVFS